jgi:hypothetical protein
MPFSVLLSRTVWLPLGAARFQLSISPTFCSTLPDCVATTGHCTIPDANIFFFLFYSPRLCGYHWALHDSSCPHLLYVLLSRTVWLPLCAARFQLSTSPSFCSTLPDCVATTGKCTIPDANISFFPTPTPPHHTSTFTVVHVHSHVIGFKPRFHGRIQADGRRWLYNSSSIWNVGSVEDLSVPVISLGMWSVHSDISQFWMRTFSEVCLGEWICSACHLLSRWFLVRLIHRSLKWR